MAEIISYPEKSILSGNDYLLISDSQNSYITKKTKVSDINALVFSNAIEGSGTTNYIPKFTSTKVIGNSNIYDNGTNIGIGTNSPSQKLHVSGNARVTGAYYDSTDSPGTSGHILSSTVSGTRWVSTLPGGPYLPLTGGTLSGNLSILKSQPSFSLIDTSSGSSISYIQNIGGNLYHVAGGSSVDNIFQSGSTQTMVIKGNGNVGIGTTNPTNRLHVEGGITKLDSKSFTSNTLGLYSNFDSTAIVMFADDPIANSGMINISSSNTSGNNEIGMNFATGGFSSTNVKLSILNTGQLKANSYGSGSFTGTATQRLAVDTNGNVIELPIGSGPVDGSGTANYLTKWIDSDTIGNSIAYDSGSQLLLNATSSSTNAQSKLYIDGDSWVTGSYIIGSAGSSEQKGKLFIDNNKLTLQSTGSFPIQFKSGTNTFMYINTSAEGGSGRVGVGTTNPTQKMVVKKSGFGSVDIGATVASGATLLAAGGNEDYGTFFATQGLSDNYTGLIQQRRQSAATFYNLSLNPYGGNVGIGTTSPATKLHIDSNSSYPALTIARSTTHPNISFTAGVTNFSGSGADLVFDTVGNDTGFGFRTRNNSGTLINTLILNPSGNVGIGTTSPSEKLEVIGNIKIIESGQSPNISVFHSDGSYAKLRGQGLFLSRATSYVAPEADNFGSLAIGYNGTRWGNVEINAATVKFENGANEWMRINSSGNVGIGTTSPVAKLDVAGNGTGPSVYSYAYAVNAGMRIHGNESALDIIGTDSGNHGSSILLRNADEGFGFVNNPNIDALQLKSFTANNNGFSIHGTGDNLNSLVDIITIEKAGNVGIGTASPSGPLHIKSSSNSNIVYVDTSGNALSDNAYINFNGSRAQVGWIDAAVTLTDGGGNKDIKLKVNNGSIFFMTSNTARMFVNSSGNVGIGTTGPISKLHIVETSTISPALYIDTARYGASIIGDGTSNTQYLLNLQSNGGSTDVMRVQSSGNVGIGTTSPGAKLTIKGSGLTSQDFFHIEDSGGVRMLEVTSDPAGNSSLQVKDTSGSTKSLINSSGNSYFNGGNVGIGTTSPSSKLEIAGSGNQKLLVNRTDGDNFFIDAQNGQIRLRGSNNIYMGVSGDLLTVTNTNVGIGTTSPQAKLDISTTGTGDSMIIRNDDASSLAAPVLMLLRDSASAANGDYLGQIKFKGNSDTGAERVYAKITAKISDATNTAEDSLIETAVRNNGANLIVSRQTHTDLKLINGTGLESDGDIYMPVIGKGPIIRSPDGTRYRIIVDNSGNLSTETA